MGAFDIRSCSIKVVDDLCRKYHAYKSASSVAVYSFAVYENGIAVAAFSWQPPPFGAAKSVCGEFPQGVLSLSRMVAAPKNQRMLKHISKPLMFQMKKLIDRERWPVLITYSDASVGHTGYVYQCSGFEKCGERKVRVFKKNGARASVYSNGLTGKRELSSAGTAIITRWEHWACERGFAKKFSESAGWVVCKIQGKVWSSGRQANTVVKIERQLFDMD